MNKFLSVMLLSLLAFASPSYAWFTPDGADVQKTKAVFEGATDDDYEFTVNVPDPAADQSGFIPLVSTVAGLPTAATANKGQLAVVTDADDTSDCTSGGNTTVNTCVSNGSAWVVVS